MNQQESPQVWTPEELITTRKALGKRVARWTSPNKRTFTAISDLSMSCYTATTQQTCSIHEPSLCLVAQGAKRVVLGKETYTYDAYHFLITSVELPVVAQVIEASPDKPYLGVVLGIDRRSIAQMLVENEIPIRRPQQTSRGMVVSEVTLPLLNAFTRLIDLLDTPEDIPMLAPLVQREILYRLLVSDQGERLRQIGAAGTQSHQIALAIDWLRENYKQPLHIEDLATHAKMSSSTLHRHFRTVTAMSPLQFQKSLRLHEARRLMLTEHLDAASAAFQVGYESHSQFNREYSRFFGAPPLRDMKALRQVATNVG